MPSLSSVQLATMPTYQYQPLRDPNEIRLVSLLPGTFDDPIRISIYHSILVPATAQGKPHKQIGQNSIPPYPWNAEVTSDGETLYLNKFTNETSWNHPSGEAVVSATTQHNNIQPQYEALSYTWGTNRDPETAHVVSLESDQVESFATLDIYQNLASALRHLRFVEQVRIFWVDAICINQGDIPERNTQVKRMANIYKSAYRVAAWLGRGEHNSTDALAILQYIGDQLEVVKKGSLVRAPEANEPNLWMNACNIQLDESTWQAITSILERSWFYRLWCWQEINLSSRHTIVQCGFDEVRWSVFCRAILCIHNKEKLPDILFRERCRHISFLTADAEVFPLSILLDLSRSKGCAEPRDKVYGLLGLTAPLFNASVKADYSLSVEKVYKDTFLAHASITKRLELLKHCVLAKRNIDGPSWVPDWSVTTFAAPVMSEQLATGLSSARSSYVGPETLKVVGLRCTTVGTVSAAASMEIDEALSVVPTWLKDLPNSATYLDGQTMIEAFTLTLSMNRTRERHPTNHFLSTAEFVGLLQRIVSPDVDSNEEPVYSEREIGNMIQKIRGRTFFTTTNGHIGIAPNGIEPGKSDGTDKYWLYDTDLA